jgi:hypothetical protein
MNVVGVYMLCATLAGNRRTAAVAAILFGVSSIAFTPLHWASGLIDLLAALFLIAATLLYLASRRSRGKWAWVVALLVIAAVLSKETAVAWLGAALAAEWALSQRLMPPRRLAPAAAATVGLLAWLLATGIPLDTGPSGAYALSGSPATVARNLWTYVAWCVAIWNPLRGVVAEADPHAWQLAIPVVFLAAMIVARAKGPERTALLFGLGWWVAFLLPVLALVHHSYVYYLYIPWVGGSIAVACTGSIGVARWRSGFAAMTAATAVVAFALLEWRSVRCRETAVRDHLPIDRTIRESELLRHSLPALVNASLPAASRVAFVNPVPRVREAIATNTSSDQDVSQVHESFVPLEAAMRRGETLALFVPHVDYLGFAITIPREWEDAEWFYYEQRGWLQHWGKGQSALLQQARVQMMAGRWSSAESTYQRVRALGDTLPAALEGQYLALTRTGREAQARSVREEMIQRWPGFDSLRVVPRTDSQPH